MLREGRERREGGGGGGGVLCKDTATNEIYTLARHDALPISGHPVICQGEARKSKPDGRSDDRPGHLAGAVLPSAHTKGPDWKADRGFAQLMG